jgi:uncharacterized BrkB/YihY/UPF0761 family membrane protein
MTAWPNLLPPTADLLETVWTVTTAAGTGIAALGAGITTTNLLAAVRAHRRATGAETPNRLHTAITGQSVRNEIFSVVVLSLLLFVLALFVAIGILAMLTPEPVRAELRTEDLVTTVVLVIGAAVVTIATVTLTIGSVLNRRDRHRVTNRITARLLRTQMERRGLVPPPGAP